MYRMQYHFEVSDPNELQEMAEACLEAARLAEEHALVAPSTWVSRDEHDSRLVIEFTGEDQWDCDRRQQEGQQVPELAAILAKVFKRKMTRLEMYEQLESTT
jgi:hypothetical protein